MNERYRTKNLPNLVAKDLLVFGLLFLFASLSTNLFSMDLGDRERSFVKALELFDEAKNSEDYRKVAKELESVLEDGFQSGIVYYNLGNAYFRAGEFGRSIINYRKARTFLPRDPYLKANLQQAIAAAPGRLPDGPKPWWTPVLFWSDWFSYPTRVAVCFLSLSLLAVIVLVIVFLGRSSRISSPLKWISAALLIVFLAFAIDIGLHYLDETGNQRAVIVSETIARKGTGNNYEPAFSQPLKDGAEFRILNQTKDWTFGRFEGVGEGWVRNEFLAK